MSVIVKKEGEEKAVPSEFVRCTKREAIEHQMRIINSWYPKSDVWPFHTGPVALSLMAAVSGAMITSVLRRRLKLQHYGRMAMLLPAAGIPGCFCPLLQLKLVSEPLVIQGECPVCLQMRAVLIQNVVGIGYPIVIASATGLFLAEKYATYRLPEFSFRVIPEFVNIARKMLSVHSNRILGLAAASTLVAGFITDRQANSLFTIAKKLEDDMS